MIIDVPDGVIIRYRVTLCVDRHFGDLAPMDWDWESLVGPETEIESEELIGTRLEE